MYLDFSVGNGQPREPPLCQLYRHTFVPYSDKYSEHRGHIPPVICSQSTSRRIFQPSVIFIYANGAVHNCADALADASVDELYSVATVNTNIDVNMGAELSLARV